MLVLVVLEGFVILVLVVLMAGLLRSQTDVLRRLQDMGGGGPGSGSARPDRGRIDLTAPGVAPWRSGEPAGAAFDVEGVGLLGEQDKVAVSGVGHRTLLAFLSSGCLTCADFWSRFGEPELVLPGDDTRILIVTRDAEAESEPEIRRLASGEVPTVMSSSTWDLYGVPGAPYFVLVDGPTATVIGEGSGTSWDQVAGFVEKAPTDR